MDAQRKRERLLLALRKGPLRFKELMAASGLSDVGLIKALKDLQKRGIIKKLHDGSYVLTEEGHRLAEELEVYELVREAIRRYGARAVREQVERLLKRRIAAAVTEAEVAETLIRVLRAWAWATAAWLAVKGLPEAYMLHASDEERRAVATIEAVLRKMGGERWWAKYATYLSGVERENMDVRRRAGENSICALAPPILSCSVREIVERVEGELAAIRQERLDLMETELRDALLTLLRLIEERKAILERVEEKEVYAEGLDDSLEHFLSPSELTIL